MTLLHGCWLPTEREVGCLLSLTLSLLYLFSWVIERIRIFLIFGI